jgi:hypothetical protein
MRGFFYARNKDQTPDFTRINAFVHFLLGNKCICALTVYAYMHNLSPKPAETGAEKAATFRGLATDPGVQRKAP